jgi:nucleoid DNA-binding protein
MTKQELLEIIAIEARCTTSSAARAYEAIREQLAFELRSAGRAEIPGVVILRKGQRKERTFINPSTGLAMQVSAKTTLRARCSSRMLDRVIRGGSR